MTQSYDPLYKLSFIRLKKYSIYTGSFYMYVVVPNDIIFTAMGKGQG